MDISIALSSELTRIIECPYPASLAGLAELLARTDITTIRACIHNQTPCAVSKLAALVCQALPLWASTLRVLHYLSHSSEFRHELLLQNPGLLDALLTKATSSQQGFEDHVELCVLMLSRPLPGSILLPAVAHAFFLRVFEKATRSPDVNTLRLIYCMLNGACRQVLDSLPLDARQRFDQELCNILSSNSAGKDSMLLLWCFGIVLLAEHPQSIQDMQCVQSDLEHPVPAEMIERRCKTSSGQKLFGSKEGSHKTITLTCMCVIWATKGRTGVSEDEAIESIRIASRTLRCIDQNVRESWPGSTALEKEVIIQKLHEKIMRTDISQPVLLEALCFYATVAGFGNLRPETVPQQEQCLKEVTHFADPDCLGETLATSLPAFALQMKEGTFQALLIDILEACVLAPSPQRLCNLVILVDELNAGICTSEPLRTKMRLSLRSDVVQGKMWSLIETVTMSQGASCHTYATSIYRKLLSATIALLLTIVPVAYTDEPALPPALVIGLIKKQRQFSITAHECSHHSHTVDHPSISLFQQECTPYTGQHLQDWRHRLDSELESQSFYQRESIIRSVAQICRDLETRCNTVEEPLRREQEKSTKLEQRMVGLLDQISLLEAQAIDDRLHLDGLEEERLTMADEKEKITVKLEELKVEFAEASRSAEDTLREAKAEFDANKMGYQSTMLRNEETIEAQNREIAELNATLSQLREGRDRDYCSLNERHEHLQRQLSELEQKWADERENTSRQADQITRLEQQQFDLVSQLQGTEAELEDITGQFSNLQVTYQELIESSDKALRDQEAQYISSKAAAAAKADKERIELNDELQIALEENRQIKDAYDETQREFQHLVQTKMKDLSNRCSEQEEELGELRTFRQNILASITPTTTNPLAIRSASRAPSKAADSATPRAPAQERRRRKSAMPQNIASTTTTEPESCTNTMLENMADASFASFDSRFSQDGGSSPKRPKPRPSFKVPTMHNSYTPKPVVKSKSISRHPSSSKRSALIQMSPNRRHTSVEFTVAENEEKHQSTETHPVSMRRRSLQATERSDLDMEDFLAGTPLTPGDFISGTGRAPEEDDITTTEL
ncbi:Nn.00g033880.m01.CDS01 [Neocucurbitaria sp. VM-36]